MKSSVPIGLAVAALIAPLLGVALGALLARRSEHRKWLRESRREVYARFVTASDRLRNLSNTTERDEDAILAAHAELAKARSEVVLIGSNAVHREASDLVRVVVTLDLAKWPALANDRTSEIVARGDALWFTQRWKFIEEARRDLHVKPASLPSEVKGDHVAAYEREFWGE